MRRHFAILALLTLVALTGCADSRTQRIGRTGANLYLDGRFNDAIETLLPVAQERDENFVLNNLRLGSSALAIYDMSDAERAFLAAYEQLNATNVNDRGRSFEAAAFNEKVRIWRGEPYERAIANLYLGMIYYSRQDWGNARGAFENSLFKLRDYADVDDGNDAHYSEQESDFAVAMLLLGRCWEKLGREDMAEQYFGRVTHLRPDLTSTVAAVRNPNANVMLYVEFGFGPHKVNVGEDGAGIGFRPTPDMSGRVPAPRVYVDGKPYWAPGVPLFDTVFMAQDRRWQSIDTIRTTKSAIGTGLLIGGGLVTAHGFNHRDEGSTLAGIGLMAAGALFKASSEADTRQWEMVPRSVFLVPLTLPPGEHEIKVDFPDAGGLEQTWRHLVAPSTGEETYFFRMMRGQEGPFDLIPAGVPREASAR